MSVVYDAAFGYGGVVILGNDAIVYTSTLEVHNMVVFVIYRYDEAALEFAFISNEYSYLGRYATLLYEFSEFLLVGFLLVAFYLLGW